MFSKEMVGNQNIFSNEWGIVLAGGGAKGSYQAGAIKVLYECGLIENIVGAAGSSIGAINLCLISERNPELGEKLWHKIKPLDVLDIDPELIDGKEGFSNRKALVKLLSDYIEFRKFRYDSIDYYATISEFTSTEDTTPEAKYMRLNEMGDEEVINTLLASSALPIIYEPILMNGLLYKDGGLADNIPIAPLYNRGIRKFIVILLSHNKTVDISRFPNAEFLFIKPSMDIGDLIEGTLNFNREQIDLRYKLGYADTARALKYYGTEIEKSDSFKIIWEGSVRDDINSIQTELMLNKGEKNFNKQMKKIDSIMSKYGI